MRFRISMFVDAFLGSGVPLAGDPITLFSNVSLLGLRTTTVVNNCSPLIGEIVKVRFVATNCGERRLEIRFPLHDGRGQDPNHSKDNFTALLPGESLEYSVLQTWDAPGKRQLSLAYEARLVGQPFARLACPRVTIRVGSPKTRKLMHEILRAPLAGAQSY